MAAYFVTGTDTGVGKTLVAAALLHAFSAAGKSTVGMKPVAAGSQGGRWEDVEALAAAGTVEAPRTLTNPYAFEPAIAPHIAAELEGAEIQIEKIRAAFCGLSGLADVVIVEGAGGFMIPLNARETSADLVRALQLPVILVVGMRLGCLNHALLTRQAIADCGLVCAGWVANGLVSGMPELERNIRSLEDRLQCALLGTIPHQAGITPRDAANRLHVKRLMVRSE
jgi:dethiobiotin synthetase